MLEKLYFFIRQLKLRTQQNIKPFEKTDLMIRILNDTQNHFKTFIL